MRRFLLTWTLVFVAGCSNARLDDAAGTDVVVACVEQPFRAELHVDANDRRMVWATYHDTGQDVAVRPRSPARFTFDRTRPTTLLDGGGNVVSFSGEISLSGCFDPASRTVYIGPVDLPDPNRPPN